MYTKKQKALFQGLCYAMVAWLCAAMLASLGVAAYIHFLDPALDAGDFSKKYQPALFFVVGTPAFMIGYERKMKQ